MTKEGKQPMKVARCGTACKLLHLAYAVATATKGVEFDAAYYNQHKQLRQQPKAVTIAPTTSKAS